VFHASDVLGAQRAARAVAAALGFAEQECEEVAIAASELASNLVKYACGGTLMLTPVADGQRVGIRVESQDGGPGIADVEQALTDDFSTGGSLGYGLGTVNRFVDELDIASSHGPNGGTRIVCTRWRRPAPHILHPCPLAFGAATRARRGAGMNGDAFVIKRWSNGALVAVIDGLGHGQFAQQAAHTARHYVERHYDQPLDTIFRGAARACRSTRGAVMALARFDFGLRIANCGLEECDPRSAITLSFASVGNVEARMLAAPAALRNAQSASGFVVRRGVLGLSAPSPVVTGQQWDPRALLVLHSDGLRAHWRWEEFAHLAQQPASTIAQRLLDALAKDDDDATVVVVRDEVS
jgi:anti-sigma regulatory factor (Ser/Thr protein kinase)/serine/threonine protein phosphatase PrpC